MSVQQRRDEILAKKAKLAELRKTRELRDLERAQRELGAPGSSESTAATTPNRASVGNRKDIDDLISSLVDRPYPGSGRLSRDGSPASRQSRPSSFYGTGHVLSEQSTSPVSRTPQRSSLQYTTISTATQTLPDEDSQGAEVAPPRAQVSKPETISYSVGIQTEPWSPIGKEQEDTFSDGDEPGSPSTFKTPKASKRLSRRQQDREAELRDNLRKEIEAELRAIKEPSAEDPDSEATKQRFPARALTNDELNAVTASEDFLDFMDRSSKVIERALEDEYDILADYALDGGAGADDEDDGFGRSRAKGRRIKEVAKFYDEKWSKRRMISDVNFSPKFPELCLASYARPGGVTQEYAGIVQIWNLHMQSRPEYVFHSTSDVLTARFSPFHPSYVLGGTYSGQVVLWDTRSRSALPVSKSPLSGANAGGHSHPVYSIEVVGTQNANNIISCSTDGVVCGWTTDMLSQPQEYLELQTPPPNRTEEMSPTCLAFPPADPTSFFVGTEEGNVYSCHRYDRAGAKAGVDNRIRYRGHTAPVMSLNFHSARGPVDLSDLILTSSLDWSVKLWKARPATAAAAAASSTTANYSGGGAIGNTGGANAQEVVPIMEFPRDDVVYDAQWSPTRPAVFSLVDGAGNVEVWDLLVDTEIPVAKARPTADKRVDSVVKPTPVSLNKVAWDEKEGKRIAVGGSSGLVTVFEVGSELSGEGAKSDEWAALKRLVSKAERGNR